MKVKQIEISNFKKFVISQTYDFINEEGNVNDITLLLGENGSGKSSLLQAIVFVTALASREGFVVKDFDWPGFEYRHIHSGRLPLKIKCDYQFSVDELEATHSYAKELINNGVNLHTPDKYSEVSLTFDYEKEGVIASKGRSSFYQFSGYQYAKRLSKNAVNKNQLFDRVGNIFWYSEQRTSYSISNFLDSDKPQLDYIRSFLSSAYSYHIAITERKREIKEGEFDFYDALHTLYKRIFPDRTFVGTAPRFDVFENVEAPDFFLSDGINQYELSEMSAGERSIFPILLDFARWNINNSIIVIDEIELHLHPPLQQALVRALPKLGQNNQFIITSHSNSVASMFDENQIIRL